MSQPGTACGDLYGTSKGYQHHRRADEEACPSCKAANATYNRERRKDPTKRRGEKVGSSARHKALVRLSHEHPERYRQLFIEELIKAEVRSMAAENGP